ncbi:MAG: hypothetical protein HFJ94_10165 [Muribaculaceae bacterium]|nr:hypothetical protein [Muribaculaceae bacterium]
MKSIRQLSLSEFHRDKNKQSVLCSHYKSCEKMMFITPNRVEDDVGEIWRDIKGYEGIYMVSNLGRIKHIDNAGRERLRIPAPTPNGYMRMTLSHNGKRKTISVHKEVALAFIPNPNNLSTVNHKNFDKTNNSADNLEWLSIKDNILHAKNAGKNNRIPIQQYSINGELIKEWESAFQVEKELGYFSTSISRLCRGKGKTYKGFIWKKKE